MKLQINENNCNENEEEKENVEEEEEEYFELDWTRGILQALGFKEFRSLIIEKMNENQLRRKNEWKKQNSIEENLEFNENPTKRVKISLNSLDSPLNSSEISLITSSIRSDPNFSNHLLKFQQSTHRYARKQFQWIKKRILPEFGYRVKEIEYHQRELEENNKINQWEINVKIPAVQYCQQFLRGEMDEIEKKIISQPNNSNENSNDNSNENNSNETSMEILNYSREENSFEWKKFQCHECEREYNGINEWKIHLKSRVHQIRIGREERIRKQKEKQEIIRLERIEKRKIIEELKLKENKIIEENNNEVKMKEK